jgi:nicotinate-nucleotide adenylyltransferase
MDRLRRRAGAYLVQVLFGGTFDPVHNGHVAMAMALDVTFPDATIRVIPNRQPPHRRSRVSSEHRLAMLKLAMGEISDVTVDSIELDRDGPSYSVDTLRSMRSIYGESEPVVLALGSDVVRSLESWHQPEKLLSMCHLCILKRAGERTKISGLLNQMVEFDHALHLSMTPSGRLYRLDTPKVPVSSTAVREMIAHGTLQLPVPQAIADYIGSNHLYQDTR